MNPLRFAANLTLLYPELGFLDRFSAASRDGFDGVECLFPYAWPVSDVKAALTDCGLPLVLHNLPPGDWEAGERGIACLPGRQDEFREGVERALSYARELSCPQLNCLAGICPEDLPPAEAMKVLAENVRYALSRLTSAGIRLNLEAINSRVDMPGYLLDTGDKVLSVLEQLKHPDLGLQYDIYHMKIMGGDIQAQLTDWLPSIRHIQFADTPDRGEPGSGEIDWHPLFHHLQRLGYQDWLSAEYRPTTAATQDSLSWLYQWRKANS